MKRSGSRARGRDGASKPAQETFQDYCDFSCPHAAFSDPCAVGACRRDIGVWCQKAGRYHNKHARCLFAEKR